MTDIERIKIGYTEMEKLFIEYNFKEFDEKLLNKIILKIYSFKNDIFSLDEIEGFKFFELSEGMRFTYKNMICIPKKDFKEMLLTYSNTRRVLIEKV